MSKKPHRKLLLLLLLLWASFCLFSFRTSLFGGSSSGDQDLQDSEVQPQAQHLKRSASSLRPSPSQTLQSTSSSPSSSSGHQLAAADLLSPEFDLPSSSSVRPKAESAAQQVVQVLSPTSSSYRLDGDKEDANQINSRQQPDKRTSHSATKQKDKRVNSQHAASETPSPSPSPSPRPKQHKLKPATSPKEQQHLAGAQCHYEYPNLFELQFNNIHWQKFSSSRRQELNLTSQDLKPAATFYLYNAYYDDRRRAGQPSVRVLAMIDRIHPPPTNCLLWSSHFSSARGGSATPLVTKAQFVYAWYPKWGNYEDGLLQPWIVTCPIPHEHAGLVPDSVSLVDVPEEIPADEEPGGRARDKRQLAPSADLAVSTPMSASASASSANSPQDLDGSLQLNLQSSASHSTTTTRSTSPSTASHHLREERRYDCASLQARPLTNNLPVFNRRPGPEGREKFAVCVKGLDFPRDDEHVSVRLVEWIELLSLLGAKKIFLYNLDVHENISKVLDYYLKRGLVEMSPLTLPGDQPNLPEYQHLYLKQKLTSKRQNELIPYNDCLYRNLYSYQYLALLDIDEIIMPLKRDHSTWYDLMAEVERQSQAEQNYSRASYNVRNVYFFDDLSGPLGTTQSNLAPSELADGPAAASSSGEDQEEEQEEGQSESGRGSAASSTDGGGRRESAELGIPHYLHMMSHVYRSKNYTEPGQYVKCFHNTERVISLHNHFPMNCFGQCTTYSIPTDLAHLQHYRKDCVGPLKQSCKNDFRLFTTRDTTIWRYKQRMIRRTTRVLNRLGLIERPRS